MNEGMTANSRRELCQGILDFQFPLKVCVTLVCDCVCVHVYTRMNRERIKEFQRIKIYQNINTGVVIYRCYGK